MDIAMASVNTKNKVKRYVHQPLTIEHYGIHAAIQTDGKVIISQVAAETVGQDEIEYDEVTIPASLVFKIAQALSMTRRVEYVDVASQTPVSWTSGSDIPNDNVPSK